MTQKSLIYLGGNWCERGGSRGWVTTVDLVWSTGGKFSGNSRTIEAGFEFESSVPRLDYRWPWLRSWLGWFQPFEWLVDPDDPSLLLSACVHDYFLEEARFEVLSAAAEWHSAAKKSKVPKFKRIGMFLAVCLYTLRAKHYTQA